MSAISDVIAANILVALFGCPRPLFSLIFGSLFVAKIKISAALDILSIDTVGVPIGSTRAVIAGALPCEAEATSHRCN